MYALNVNEYNFMVMSHETTTYYINVDKINKNKNYVILSLIFNYRFQL